MKLSVMLILHIIRQLNKALNSDDIHAEIGTLRDDLRTIIKEEGT